MCPTVALPVPLPLSSKFAQIHHHRTESLFVSLAFCVALQLTNISSKLVETHTEAHHILIHLSTRQQTPFQLPTNNSQTYIYYICTHNIDKCVCMCWRAFRVANKGTAAIAQVESRNAFLEQTSYKSSMFVQYINRQTHTQNHTNVYVLTSSAL